MLLIHARAGISSIHGIGLIAQEFIPAHTKIWEFRAGFDILLSIDELETLSSPARKQALHYGWFDKKLNRLIITGDDDRFTNHSEDPNTRLGADECTYAIRDIHAGDEITFDYNELGWHDLHQDLDFEPSKCLTSAST